MEDFVSRLKMHMKERDVKQIDICRETGIPTSLMSNYLTDKKSPGLPNAIAIAGYFGMGLDDFLGIVKDEPKKKMYARNDLERRILEPLIRLF